MYSMYTDWIVRNIKLSGLCIMLHYHPRAVKSTPPIVPLPKVHNGALRDIKKLPKDGFWFSLVHMCVLLLEAICTVNNLLNWLTRLAGWLIEQLAWMVHVKRFNWMFYEADKNGWGVGMVGNGCGVRMVGNGWGVRMVGNGWGVRMVGNGWVMFE